MKITKQVVKVKVKHKRSAMNSDELREYYEHGRGYTRVSEDRKAYKRSRDKRVEE